MIRKEYDFNLLAIADVVFAKPNGVSTILSHQPSDKCKFRFHRFLDAFGEEYLIDNAGHATEKERADYWHYVNRHKWGKN